MNFLQSAKNNQYVIESEEVNLTSEVQEKVSTALWEVLNKRARTVEVTRIEYRAQMHKVVGFVVEPKNRVGMLPCLIYNRGGTKDFGKILPVHLFGILAEMAEWGYVVITSQYSGAGGSEGEEIMGLRNTKNFLCRLRGSGLIDL